MENDVNIFDTMKMTDLFREIYQRSLDKKTQLDGILSDMQKHITDKNDAIMFLPRIKELLDVGVKNDDQLVKLAALCQKLISINTVGDNGEMLSEEDKEQLLKNISNTVNEMKSELSIPFATQPA